MIRKYVSPAVNLGLISAGMLEERIKRGGKRIATPPKPKTMVCFSLGRI